MSTKPDPDYEKILASKGLPVTEEQIKAEFTQIVKDEGLITNTSKMSPFWRLILAIVTAPVLWLIDALVNVVMRNGFLATAEGVFLDLFAWAVNLERKGSTALAGEIRFFKSDPAREVTVAQGVIIQTERIDGVIYQVQVSVDTVIEGGGKAS